MKQMQGPETDAAYWVRHAADRRDMFRKGDLTAKFETQELDKFDGVYALGPVAGLQGEITVYDSEFAIATVVNDQPSISSKARPGAIFLAYGASKQWREIVIDKTLNSQTEIRDYVEAQATKIGLNSDKPYLFRIEGECLTLTYHIITMKNYQAYQAQPTKTHTMMDHKKCKVQFSESNLRVKIIGFHANPEDVGKYTHDGFPIHLHFVDAAEPVSKSGHIDAVVVKAGAKLLLPVN